MLAVSLVVDAASSKIKVPILNGVDIRGIINIKDRSSDKMIKCVIYKPN